MERGGYHAIHKKAFGTLLNNVEAVAIGAIVALSYINAAINLIW